MELCINQLTKQYKKKLAVDHFSTTLTKGVYGLLGANGSGKTTLMRMLADVLAPTSGDIALNGTSIYELDESYRSVIGYLPQNFGVYNSFTAMDFMLYLAAAKGIEKRTALMKSKELLKTVGLEKEEKAKVKTFSGGMKQRLGIAQALLNDPKILLLDEPTAGLDPKERIRFRNLISEAATDRIVILSTHIVSDIENIASKILMIKDGSLLHEGTREEISSLAKGKVWSCTVQEREAEHFKDNYLISNARYSQQGVELRIISENCPHQQALSVSPSLDDAYLYCFQED